MVLNNTCKCMQTLVVATAVLHKHHLIIRVGAGLIQFVYRSHLRLATEATVTEMHFRHFSWSFRHRHRHTDMCVSVCICRGEREEGGESKRVCVCAKRKWAKT